MPEPSIIYREANDTDLPGLAEKFVLLNQAYSQLGYLLPQPENVGEAWVESFRRTLGRFSNLFIAQKDEQLVGFALCRLKRLPAHMGGVLVGELSDIWTAPEQRREGIGRQLTVMVLQWLHAAGAHSVEVQVLRDNHIAWKMFEQLGFLHEYTAGRLLWDNYQQPEETV
jgi:ribosomal protein S18 acetylase RimI-like enzyme